MAIIFTRLCLYHGLPSLKQAWIVKYLLLGWGLNAIAKEVGVTAQTVYNAQNNITRYGSVIKPL